MRWPGGRQPPALPVRGSNAALPQGPFDPTTTHRTSYTPKEASAVA